MEEAGNERFLRYMLLLSEGGQLVLKNVLLREVSKRKPSLEAILSNSRHNLSEIIKNQHQYKQIFPTQSTVNADISTWDITLLCLIIIHVFGKDLPESELKDVKDIYESRIRLEGMVSSLALQEADYRKMRLHLAMCLLHLSSATNFETQYECLDIVSTSGVKPLSLHSTLQQLAELHEFENETLEAVCSKLEITMKDLDANSGETEFVRRMSGIKRDSSTRSSRGKRSELRTESWYFGKLTREETNEIFEKAKKDGVFLVRDCLSNPGDFVLCVREGGKICQYVISRLHADGEIVYRIGEKDFEDMPALLEFYTTHYLDKTPLTESAPRKKFLTKYDFEGNDPKDLPFKKGDVLEIVSKEDDKWWYAMNSDGKVGIVPKLYLTALKEEDETDAKTRTSQSEPQESEEKDREISPTPPVPKRLPSKAVVTKTWISSPYNDSQLTLHEGDIVIVTKIIGDGHCWGDYKGKSGLFPSKNVTFLDDL